MNFDIVHFSISRINWITDVKMRHQMQLFMHLQRILVTMSKSINSTSIPAQYLNDCSLMLHIFPVTRFILSNIKMHTEIQTKFPLKWIIKRIKNYTQMRMIYDERQIFLKRVKTCQRSKRTNTRNGSFFDVSFWINRNASDVYITAGRAKISSDKRQCHRCYAVSGKRIESFEWK